MAVPAAAEELDEPDDPIRGTPLRVRWGRDAMAA